MHLENNSSTLNSGSLQMYGREGGHQTVSTDRVMSCNILYTKDFKRLQVFIYALKFIESTKVVLNKCF